MATTKPTGLTDREAEMSPQLYSPAAASFALRLVMQGLDAAARHENLFQEAPYALFLSWGHMKKALFFFLPTSHSGVKCVCGHIFAFFKASLITNEADWIQNVVLRFSQFIYSAPGS